MASGGDRQWSQADSRGQSETIGTVLILALTVIGATATLAFGATALDEARADAHGESVENAMTQLDSRTARVALGDSSVQRVPLAAGNYRVDPDSGWINITHLNHTGNGDNEVIYNDTLGAVIYDRNEVTVAYQGGGVWRSNGDASSLVSPPEFHYRGSTLTLPIVRLMEADSAAGPVSVTVKSDGQLDRIYPDESENYAVGSAAYSNPVDEGNVSVTIQSDYYQAWAEYFRTRTEGEITVDDSTQTVEAILFTPSSVGDFAVPQEGNGVNANRMGSEHPVSDFEITLKPDPHFENMHWAFYANEGGQEFELHIHSPAQCTGGNPGTYDGELDLSIYYYDSAEGQYEGWQNSSVDPDTSSFVGVDCGNEELTIDFMGTTPLQYGDITTTGGDSKWHYGDQISTLNLESPATFDQHTIDDAAGDRDGSYSSGETEEMGFLVNHYLELLGPNFELSVTDGPGGSSRVDEGSSNGTLDYDQAGSTRFITYLHITENRVSVEFE